MVEYDPFSEEVMTDPHRVYRKLRDEAPVYYVEKYDCWALSRFEDIWQASTDAKSYSVAKGTASGQILTKIQPVTPMLAVMDPPAHSILRSALRVHFSPARVRSLEPTIRELYGTALGELVERGGGDVVGDVGTRVATKVASIVAGIPLEDGELLYELVQRFFGRDDETVGMTEDGVAAAMEMNDYFEALARRRRAEGTNGEHPLDTFLEIEIDGRRFEEAEVASHMAMLLIGGSETFPKVFANLLVRLEQYPDQRAAVAADPERVPDAFIEGLRYDMPTQFLGRTLLKDVELHGETMRAGQAAIFLFASANRDDREFENPDVFDVNRRPPRILGFGHGVHSCLGIHVAKTEGRIALEEMLRRAPEYEVDHAGAERLRTEFVQGYLSLPLRVR